jgi:hypothetical protein
VAGSWCLSPRSLQKRVLPPAGRSFAWGPACGCWLGPASQPAAAKTKRLQTCVDYVIQTNTPPPSRCHDPRLDNVPNATGPSGRRVVECEHNAAIRQPHEHALHFSIKIPIRSPVRSIHPCAWGTPPPEALPRPTAPTVSCVPPSPSSSFSTAFLRPAPSPPLPLPPPPPPGHGAVVVAH